MLLYTPNTEISVIIIIFFLRNYHNSEEKHSVLIKDSKFKLGN